MKTPLFRLQYEVATDNSYTEVGSDTGAKFSLDTVANDEVRRSLSATSSLSYKDTILWLSNHTMGPEVAVTPLTTHTPEAMAYRLSGKEPQLLFVMRPLHTVERLDELLYAINRCLPQGAYMWCHTMTASLQRMIIMKRFPWGMSHLVVAVNYLWHRVCPKLKLTHRLYFAVTGGKKRTMSRVEVIGRLYRAGFEVVDERFNDGEFFVVAHKVKNPIDDAEPTGSPVIHLRRIGKDGKEIVVHKFRTMYTYSEYVQSYIYHYQSLERGGKFKGDYRVNFWGRFLRRIWLDELPMIWNLLRGDIKLVGVRPLSRQYFSLYTPEMQALRTKTKPGLLPPFYYEEHTPETIEEIQASERRYLEAYLNAPFKTDWKYFWGIIGNILFHKKHSA